MFAARVEARAILRLDAEYYDPLALAEDAKVRLLPFETFGDLVAEGYRVVYHGVDDADASGGVPFLSPTDISDDGEYEVDRIGVRLPAYYVARYPKGVAKPGELLIEVKGNTSKVAVVRVGAHEHMLVSGSLYKAALHARVDSHFVLAFLRSRPGNLLKRRVVSNINIAYLGKDDLYRIPVPQPATAVQRYLGSKVRQAEDLRARARTLLRDAQSFFATLHRIDPNGRRGSWRRAPKALAPERLDASFYSPPAMALAASLASSNAEMVEAHARLHHSRAFNPSISLRYFEIGGIDTASGTAWPENVGGGEAPARAQRSVRPWDLLVATVRPERKNVGVVPDFWTGQLVASSGFAVLRAADSATAMFLWAYLRSDASTEQLLRWNTGAAYPAIDDDVPLSILIPRYGANVVRTKGTEWCAIPPLLANARALVDAARLLVEALIERKVTEAELIAAAGDPAADRALLARLTVEGLDAAGDPVFPDIDALGVLVADAGEGGAP